MTQELPECLKKELISTRDGEPNSFFNSGIERAFLALRQAGWGELPKTLEHTRKWWVEKLSAEGYSKNDCPASMTKVSNLAQMENEMKRKGWRSPDEMKQLDLIEYRLFKYWWDNGRKHPDVAITASGARNIARFVLEQWELARQQLKERIVHNKSDIEKGSIADKLNQWLEIQIDEVMK